MTGVGRLAGKVVIVSGAAHGIGAATARALIATGARVSLADVDDVAGRALADELGPSACFFKHDIRDSDGWVTIAEALFAEHGRIDGLVNNAGVNVKYRPLEMPETEWDRCMDLNLRGAWLGARAMLPAMLAAGAGSIVNIASIFAHRIIPGAFPYPVAKHGLIGLTRALAVEYAGRGVRVNSISPGYVDTRMNWEYWDKQDDPAAARAESEALIPIGRIVDPREVAMTALFLLSDEAPSITGVDIPVDGGRLALYHD